MKSNRKGSLLITALLAMAFFSVLAASLAWGAAQQTAMMKRLDDRMQARLDCTSVIQGLAYQLSLEAGPAGDTRSKSWYGPWPEVPFVENRMSVHVEDEEGKLNLNYATEAWLDLFFKRLEEKGVELRGDVKKYARLIKKLRTERRIKSVETLLMDEDFDTADYGALLQWVTVYPEDPRVNLNTADLFILDTLIEVLAGDYAVKQILKGRLFEFLSSQAVNGNAYFSAEELQPDIFMRKLKLPVTPPMTMVVQAFLSGVTADSEFWRLQMTAQSRLHFETVLRLRPGELYPSILKWQER